MEGNPEYRFQASGPFDQYARKDIQTKDLTPLTLGRDRALLKKEALIEASYEPNGSQKRFE